MQPLEELAQAVRPVDRERRLVAAAQRERLQHPRQAEEVVGVEVREEDLLEVGQADRRALQLPLRPLAAVEEEPLAAAADEHRRGSALRGRHRRGGTEEDDVEIHAAIVGSRGAGPDRARGLPARDHAGAVPEIRELYKTHSIAEDARDLAGPHLDADAGLRVRARPDRPPLGGTRRARARFYTELLTAFPDIVLRPDRHRDRAAGRLRGGERHGDAAGAVARPGTGRGPARVEGPHLVPVGSRAAALPRREGLHLRDRPARPGASNYGTTSFSPGEIVAEARWFRCCSSQTPWRGSPAVRARRDRPERVARDARRTSASARRRTSRGPRSPTARAARHTRIRSLPNICSHSRRTDVRLSRSRCENGVDELGGAEAHRIVGRQARLRLGRRDRRARLVLAERPRVERDRDDPRRARRQREPLVQLDELAQRRDRMRPAAGALDLASAPASWQRTSRCGALPW